jgi:hypothetical protein
MLALLAPYSNVVTHHIVVIWFRQGPYTIRFGLFIEVRGYWVKLVEIYV